MPDAPNHGAGAGIAYKRLSPHLKMAMNDASFGSDFSKERFAMGRLFALLIAASLFSTVSAAATKFKVSPCEYERQQELDAAAAEAITTNNFSDGWIYTAVALRKEDRPYASSVGNALVVLGKDGLTLMSFDLCNQSGSSDHAMDTADVTLDENFSLSRFLKSGKPAKVNLEGSDLSSDEHVALKGSLLELKIAGTDRSRTIVEAKIKLIVASLTDDDNADAEDGHLKATEILEGVFYFFVADAKLVGKP